VAERLQTVCFSFHKDLATVDWPSHITIGIYVIFLAINGMRIVACILHEQE